MLLIKTKNIKIMYSYIKLFFLLTLGMSVIYSCQDVDDVHKHFISDGEIIYTNKVDSLKKFAGRNRVQISGNISFAYNVTDVVVSWNKGEDEQVFAYTKTEKDTDTLNLIVLDLEEKSYEFKVFSKDADRNISVPETVFVASYGEKFRSNLEARSVNAFLYSGTDAVITLGISNEYQRDSEIKFINNSGAEVTVSVARDTANASLPNVKLDETIEIRTYFVPTLAVEGVETSIDKFDSDWSTVDIPAVEPIFKSFMVATVLDGVKVNWKNPEALDLKFTFAYNTVAGEVKTVTTDSSDVDGEVIITEMDAGNQEINITIADLYGNSFGPRSYPVSP